MENIKRVTIRNTIVKLLNVISIFIFIKTPDDLALYVALSVGFSIFGQLILWLDVRKYVTFTKVSIKEICSHLKPSFVLFIPQIAVSIYAMLDKTMIGLIVNDVAEVGFYAKAQQFVNMFMFIITSIGTVMMPRIVNLNANNEKEKSLNYINSSFNVVMLLAFPIAFGLAAIAPFFVNWFLTPEFAKTAGLMMALCPIIVAVSITNVLGIQLLIPIEKTREYTISVVASAIINFILNLILIRCINSYGAAIATVVAEYTVLIIQIHFTKKYINFKSKLPLALRYFTFGLIMFAVMMIIGRYMGISFVTNLVQFIVGTTIYLGLLFIFKDETAKKVLKLLKGLTKKGC